MAVRYCAAWRGDIELRRPDNTRKNKTTGGQDARAGLGVTGTGLTGLEVEWDKVGDRDEAELGVYALENAFPWEQGRQRNSG